MQAKIVEVQKAVRQGGPWQQLTAVTLMRITPIVPFRCERRQGGEREFLHGPCLRGFPAEATFEGSLSEGHI
eukprot:349807-Chlamydomonas_euryale.AAC.1